MINSNKEQTAPDWLIRKINGLEEWIANNGDDCKKRQLHLIKDTPERIYWHFGYLMALKDALPQLPHSGQT